VNDFGFEQAIDRFGQGVVKAISDAANRRRDFGFGQPSGVFNR
jgi:hypothetical protein